MRMDKRQRFCKIAPLELATHFGVRMSHHDNHEVHQADSFEPDPADSRADAVAAFFAIAIAVCGVLFFISQQ
jgi:hypothetical protein